MDKQYRSKYEWIKNPVWAILSTLLGFVFSMLLVALFIEFGLSQFIKGDSLFSGIMIQLVGVSSIALTVFFVVYCFRKLGRQSLSGLRLHFKRSAVVELVVGILLALFIILIVNIASVTLGATEWEHWDQNISMKIYAMDIFLLFVFVLLGQAFPEELLFRGHLFDTLSSKVSYNKVLFLTS